MSVLYTSMTNNPDWPKILDFLRSEDGSYQREVTSEEIESCDLTPPQVAKKELVEDLKNEISTHSDSNDLKSTIGFLENRLGFVEFTAADERATLKLKREGFKASHDRELGERRDKSNDALVFFTLALVLVDVIGLIPTEIYRITMSVLLLIVLLYVVNKAGLLDLHTFK